MTDEASNERADEGAADEETYEAAVEERLLGVVEVGTGTLVIGDPDYLVPELHGRTRLEYREVREADTREYAVPVADGMALLVQRFGGGERFPVYGEFVDDELMAVRVDFVDPAEEWE